MAEDGVEGWVEIARSAGRTVATNCVRRVLASAGSG